MGINRNYITVKSIKKNTVFPDTYFVSKYSLSPYMACQHACKYCDGRSEKYFIKGDFEKDIVIRGNVHEVLETRLIKSKERGIVSIASGVSDPYQPAEVKEGLMRKILQVIDRHKYPVSIMTKSKLLLRDIDLLESINNHSKVIVYVSLVYPDDEDRIRIEPYTSSVAARLEMIKILKSRGITVGVLMMPLIPFISDKAEAVDKLGKCLFDLDVDIVMPGLMTLRPGVQKISYFKFIGEHYPELLEAYRRTYSNNAMSGSPQRAYTTKVVKIIENMMAKYSFSDMMTHKVYRNQFPIYDEVFILLKHMVKLYKRKGIDIDPLVLGIKGYSKWLETNKKTFNRRRNLNQSDLEAQLVFELTTGLMDDIINNRKLVEFMKNVVIHRKVFNYKLLKFEED